MLGKLGLNPKPLAAYWGDLQFKIRRYGWGGKMKANGGRVFVALHEGKVLLNKVLHGAPGCDGQSLNKLHGRAEFSNTVPTAP